MKSVLTHLIKIGLFTSLSWAQLASIQSESGLEILLGGEIQNYKRGWGYGVILGSVLIGFCYSFGRIGLSLHLTENAVYLRSLSYGFFNEKVFSIGGGSLQVFEDDGTITLYFTPSGGEMIRIESGLDKDRSEEMMKRIEAVIAKKK